MTPFQIIQAIYSVSAIGLWGVLAGIVVRYGRPAFALGVDLVAALTRMSDAMKTSAADAGITREATMRIEDTCGRIETELREVRVAVATLAARPQLVSIHEEEPPSHEPVRRPRASSR